jgi:hypothetical protein
MGNFIFQKEKLKDIYEEMYPILMKHWEEISHYLDIPLEPDKLRYLKQEEDGICHVWTARDESKLIGYAVFMIGQNPHYKSSKQAYQDILYISKENRGFGKSFISWCDDRLREMGVQVVRHHIKFSHDWSPVLERMGYTKEDIILSKRLDK